MIADWIEWKLRIKLNRSKQIAKNEINTEAWYNVTPFYGVHVIAYMIGWAQSLDRWIHVQEVAHDGSELVYSSPY